MALMDRLKRKSAEGSEGEDEAVAEAPRDPRQTIGIKSDHGVEYVPRPASMDKGISRDFLDVNGVRFEAVAVDEDGCWIYRHLG